MTMVEWKKLNDLLNFEQPTPYLVKSTEYSDSFDTPVLTAGQSLLLGYTDEKDGIYKADTNNPTIIFDDFTTSFHWVDYDFKVKSSAMKMLRPKNGVCFRYVFYAMKCIGFIPSGHQRHWISKYSQFEIPYPSISEQERIVGILDTFTASIDNLKAQIEQRRKQYEHYRDSLLDLEGKEGVEMKKLGEVVIFRNGKGHEKIIDSEGKYIVVNSKFISSNGYVKKKCKQQLSPLYVDDILMVMSDVPNGKALAKCYLVEKNDIYTLNQRIGAFHLCDNNVSTKYLFYVINRNEQLLQYDNKIDQTNLRKEDILNIHIPLPSLQEQERIVGILDTFEAGIANLEAQLEQRQKQYEYYREKLLTFE